MRNIYADEKLKRYFENYGTVQVSFIFFSFLDVKHPAQIIIPSAHADYPNSNNAGGFRIL